MNESNELKIENIQVGMVVKNYKVMCELLGEKEKNGHSKESQLKKWQSRFHWIKDGHKFIIKEIYDEPLPIEDGRSEGNNGDVVYKRYNNFNVPKEYARKPGVYKIENDEYIYIGSTVRYLSERFYEHYNNYGGLQDKTQEVLHNGGIFTCLKSFEKGSNERIVREAEAEFIRLYRNTDKILLNDTLPEIISEKEKIKYKTIRIPQDCFDDVVRCLNDGGYLIMNKTVFNKKFID